MKLTGMMAVLGRFISKLGEKGLPFFKLLKKSDKFKWTDEVDQAFEELKTFLTTPPIMVPPAPKETLLLYISVSTQVVSVVLVAERRAEGHQYPVSDLSTMSARSYPTARLGTRNLKTAICYSRHVAQAAPLLPVAQDQSYFQFPPRRNLMQLGHHQAHR
jgi:hypothetical protein